MAGKFVVVGVDGSASSIGALQWAESYALAFDAELHVITAFDIPWTIYITPTSTDDFYRGRAQAVLEQTLLEAFPDGPRVPTQQQVLQSRPSVALTAAAKGADLLVVGATGHGAIPDMHIGSVATACSHRAPCPVLVWRSTES